jgi:hypothetical protein
MSYNHMFQIEVTLSDGSSVWLENLASELGVDTSLGYQAQAEAAKEAAMADCRCNGMQPASAEIVWADTAQAAMQDLESAHKMVSDLLELIRDEAPSYVLADAVALTQGHQPDRIES